MLFSPSYSIIEELSRICMGDDPFLTRILNKDLSEGSLRRIPQKDPSEGSSARIPQKDPLQGSLRSLQYINAERILVLHYPKSYLQTSLCKIKRTKSLSKKSKPDLKERSKVIICKSTFAVFGPFNLIP